MINTRIEQSRYAPGAQTRLNRQSLRYGAIALGVSVCLHGAVLLVGWTALEPAVPKPRAVEQQMMVPDATTVPPTLAAVPALPEGTASAASPRLTGLSTAGLPALPARPSGGIGLQGMPDREGSALRGIAPTAMQMSGGGTLAPFGQVGGADALPPKSPFMGVNGNAYRIAYVCDASGPMVNAQAELKRKLKESVQSLKPSQSFTILFFNEAGVETLDETKLLAATPKVKREVLAEGTGWIDAHYRVQLGADPVPALRMAFAQKPELVYLLTCGLSNRKDPQLPARVREEVKRLNAAAGGTVHVSTILVLPAPKEQRLADQGNLGEGVKNDVQVLTLIAQENGGRFALAMIE